MSILIKNIIPEFLKKKYKAINHSRVIKQTLSYQLLNENDFISILTERIGLSRGDTVFIHSSIDQLNLSFPFFKILNILLEIVGPEGTILFPTYPRLTSYRYLNSGEVFDIRKTQSFTGALNEYARRKKIAVRSLHPTKSCLAIGKDAHAMTDTHQNSPYPYSPESPYYKIMQNNAKLIGLGVESTYVSFIHSVDDFLGEGYPVEVYYKNLFKAKCIDYNGEITTVPTYAHRLEVMNFNIPAFFDKYVDKEIINWFDVGGNKFYTGSSVPLFNRMYELALDRITIYKPKYYKKFK